MRRKVLWSFILVISLAFFAAALVPQVRAADAPRMTKEELKGMLGTSDLIVVDVRAGRDWTSSEFKIQGAARGDPGDVASWAGKYDKTKTIVLYCA
ncbi:MAG: Rhodanese-related sulfurtransferase [Desulfacinum sp.]|jgi:hypothetical protein|nr:Rhodanese-related sulfurtransferase [Desulfacinum sp.]